MKKIFAYCLLFIVYCLLLSSCEKNITLDLPTPESKLVVEGYIYQDSFPFLFLTKNAPFFSNLDSSALQQYVVKGANITVSDGITTDVMQEFTFNQLTVYVCLNANL